MGIYGDLLKLNDKKPDVKPQKRTEKPAAPKQSIPTVSNVATSGNEINQATVIPRHHATTTPRNRGGTVSRYHDTLIQAVRAAVKQFGKEAATHRFTLQEKKAIADIVYAYKQSEIKTNENVITRIGVNFIISDYRENGENSVLHRVLEALNS